MAIPSISETTLLKSLWKQQPLSASEIHGEVVEELGWSYSSTRKTLERVLEKGAVRQYTRYGVQVYEAVLEKLDTLAAFANDFGKRVTRPYRSICLQEANSSMSMNLHSWSHCYEIGQKSKTGRYDAIRLVGLSISICQLWLHDRRTHCMDAGNDLPPHFA